MGEGRGEGGGGVEWRSVTLQDVHADQLGALWSAAELVLQEVASLKEKKTTQKTKRL